MTIQEIQDNYAKEQGFDDWADLYRRAGYYDEEKFFMHENKVFELIQQEQQILIAENVELVQVKWTDDYEVDKSSIINENNIIR